MPKRSRAQRIADCDNTARVWQGSRGVSSDTLSNADKRRKAWVVTRDGWKYMPKTRATPREYVKGMR